MGDYLIGYADDVDFRIADVMAISAAFPGGIGPYCIKTAEYQWYKFDSWEADAARKPTTPTFEKLYISDGGLYDNLGLEPFYDASKRQLKSQNSIDYLIVSDASSALSLQQRGFFWQVLRRTKRLIDIIYDQVRLMRMRGIVPYFLEHSGRGIYLQIGMTPHLIHCEAEKAGASIPKKLRTGRYFSEVEVCKVTNYPTNLTKLNDDDFMLIERHGYETAENFYYIFPPFNACGSFEI
jgi:NTE family protein